MSVSETRHILARLRQRRIGADQAGRAFDHDAFEPAGLNGKILGKKPRQRQAGLRRFAEPDSCQRLLRQVTAAGGDAEQPQIGAGAGQRRIGVLAGLAD